MAEFNPIFEDETMDAIRARLFERILGFYPDPNMQPDIREGSLFWDLYSPISAELNQVYVELDNVLELAFIQTSRDEFLDLRGDEIGVARNEAVASTGYVRFLGEGGVLIPLGTTVSTITQNFDEEGVLFDTTEVGTIAAVADPTSRNEIQTLESDHTSGQFAIKLGSETTNLLDYNSTAGQIEAELELLPSVDDVTVSGGPLDTDPIEVEFTGAGVSGTDMPLMEIVTSTLAGGTLTNEVQKLFIDGDAPTSGTFDLSVDVGAGPSLVTLNWSDNDVDIQAAFEFHPDIDPGDVLVTSTGGTLSQFAIFTIEFTGALEGLNIDTITLSANNLDPVTAIPTIIEVQDGGAAFFTETQHGINAVPQVQAWPQNDIQTLTFIPASLELEVTQNGGGIDNETQVLRYKDLTNLNGFTTVGDNAAAGGTFTLTVKDAAGGPLDTTGDIDFDASAADVQTELEALATYGGGGSFTVTATIGGPNLNDPGTEFEIEFTGTNATTDFSATTITAKNITNNLNDAGLNNDLKLP